MNAERRCFQAGAAMVVLAVFLRLVSTGAVAAFFQQPVVLSLMVLSETGRWVRPDGERVVFTPVEEVAPLPEADAPAVIPEAPVKAVFSPSDSDLVAVNSACGYSVDVETMLAMPLNWDLTEEGPAVLIVHSHGSESYEKTEDYEESSAYRTLDARYNVVSVGERIAETLEAGGIGVLHDKALHDYPSYNNAYGQSRVSVEAYLQKYPSIRVVLDIHRDSLETEDGKQIGRTVSLNGQETAQLMMVVGTDAGGLSHPNWKENMALAVKLHAQLEKLTPGICRPISFRSQRFNQDLSSGALIVEVGAAGNTRQEALLAGEQLAAGILKLAYGTEGEIY